GTLLRARRQELHARVAMALEQRFPDLVERRPELLAHHLTAAGDTERAIDQWLKAGQHAAARLAHVEAIRHFERGLATLAALPASTARDGWEIDLQLARGLSLFTVKGSRHLGRRKRMREHANWPSNKRMRVGYSLRSTASGRQILVLEHSARRIHCQTDCWI